MRIGLFTDTYPPQINGVATSVLVLKRALEKKGHQVYVVTLNDNMIKYSIEENGTVIRVPGVPLPFYDYRLAQVYPLKVVNLLRKWKLDVIHSHTEFSVGIFARLAAKQHDIPLVHTYHTMYEDYTHYITKGYFDKSSKKIVEYLTMFYCDKTAQELIVPTQKTYQLFKEKYHFEKNISILPTGLEVERFYKENTDKEKTKELKKELGITKEDFPIIFVGRLAVEKNVEFLLNIIKDLSKKNPNIKLIIVGDGPDREKFEEISKKHKTERNVIFTGKVPYDIIPNYYQLAKGFITASKSETQGLTVVEAMAAELVPFCINDEAFKTVIVDGLSGIIFNNEKEAKQAITEISSDEKERKKYSHQARVAAERCSSKYYAEGALDVYERAIEEKRKTFKEINRFLGIFKRRKNETSIESQDELE